MTTTEPRKGHIDTLARTRESWLRAAIEVFRPRFVEVGYPLPEVIHVSVGFSYGARAENGVILGCTWKRNRSDDNANHVFITPEDNDTARILETLLHELIHVALDCEDDHRKRFAYIATRLGFQGPMTETPASPSLAFELISLAAELGEYPHSALHPAKVRADVPVGPDGKPIKVSSAGLPQSNRHMKLVCPVHPDYFARSSRKTAQSPPACGKCLDEGTVTRMILVGPDGMPV